MAEEPSSSTGPHTTSTNDLNTVDEEEPMTSNTGGEAVQNSWNPITFIGLPAAVCWALSTTSNVVKGVNSGLCAVTGKMLSKFGIAETPKAAVSPQTKKPNTSSGVIGSVVSNIDDSMSSGGKLTSLPVNKSTIDKVEVHGLKPGATIGSTTSNISRGDCNIDNISMEISPKNCSEIKDSIIKNTNAIVGSTTSDIKFGKGSSKGLTIECKPQNDTKISGLKIYSD